MINLKSFILIFNLFLINSIINVIAESCIPGKDQTIFANNLISNLKLNPEIKLPQRYIGSIFLKFGGMLNISTIRLIDEPVKVICANKSLGAIQLKLSIDQVILGYSWSFGEKCEGLAKALSQDIFLDINIEKNFIDNKNKILNTYTSALTGTDFNIIFKKCTYFNVKTLETQVKNVCKKAALHDVDLVLQSLIKPIIKDFIEKNNLELS